MRRRDFNLIINQLKYRLPSFAIGFASRKRHSFTLHAVNAKVLRISVGLEFKFSLVTVNLIYCKI